MTFNIQKWRKQCGWSVIEASRRLGLHRNTIGKYESGELPTPRTVELACRALEAGISHTPTIADRLRQLNDPAKSVELALRRMLKNPDNVAAVTFDRDGFYVINQSKQEAALLSDSVLEAVWVELTRVK